MSLLGRKQFYALWKEIAVKIKKVKCTYKNLSLFKRIEYIVFPLIIIILLTSFLIPYITTILQLPLEETDALKYGTLGKIFFEEKSLEYRWIRVYPKTGYYLINNHAPSFSLFLTWEKIIDSLFRADANKDIYYKSISGYYALLILSVFIYWISKKSKYLALLGVFLLLSGTSFFFTLFQQHLDSYRLFFLILSWIFLAFAIEKKDTLSFFLLGTFSGLAAFAHTIGAALVLFNCLTLILFLKCSKAEKISRTSFVVILMIIFGWFHYILDILWGFGWVIFDRQVTWWG